MKAAVISKLEKVCFRFRLRTRLIIARVSLLDDKILIKLRYRDDIDEL